MFSKLALSFVALGMLAFAIAHMLKVHAQVPPSIAPMEPAQSPFAATIAGNGMVEPRSENIAVGAEVPGVVTEVLVKVGQKVTKGAPLFRLDDRHLQARLAVCKSDLGVAESRLAKMKNLPRPEDLPLHRARVREAKARLVDLEIVYRRGEQLSRDGAITGDELTRRKQAVAVAREQVAVAQADLDLLKAGAWKYDLDIARAQCDQAQALVNEVKIELSRLTVCAPITGDVLQVKIHPGEYVSTPSRDALLVVGDVENLYVRVDVDEEDIPRFNTSARVKAMVRGNPRQEMTLEFVRVEPMVLPKRSLTGGPGTERVDTRVLQVLYRVANSKGVSLFVGQQLEVFIEVAAPSSGSNK